MIRVTIADDQTLVRQGIKSLLGLTDDLQVVHEASDGDEALKGILEMKPDVALLDIRMPKKTGLKVAKILSDRGLKIPVILLTTFDDSEVLLEAVRLGVAGYLLKDVSLDQLAAAIRVVASGKTLILPGITHRATEFMRARPNSFDALPAPEKLTQREIEILRLIAGGYSNGEIANALGTAEGTVKNHASNVFSKLGVRDRTQAVLKALELGYLV